jgi:hypothetical protein
MDNTMFTEKSTETTRQILIPIIRIYNFDSGIKLGLNHSVRYRKKKGQLTVIF